MTKFDRIRNENGRNIRESAGKEVKMVPICDENRRGVCV